MDNKEMTKNETNRNRFLDLLEEAAGRSLTDEVDATPKPGLVDQRDSGAHKDMDYQTFEISIRAIRPFIRNMAQIGVLWDNATDGTQSQTTAEHLFTAIRPAGIQAEQAMFAATGGINTHKGIIFSMGLAAAAAGFLFRSRFLDCSGVPDGNNGAPVLPPLKAEDILMYCGTMCRRSMERDFSSLNPEQPKTHGELLYFKYGCRGIRGEAADSFPAIREVGLPALREFVSHHTIESPVSQNHLSLHILLHLMAEVDDTNVLFRTDYSSLRYVKEQAASILTLGGSTTSEGMAALIRLNTDFIKRNISPGGCADLLSMTLFLWRLEHLFSAFDKTYPIFDLKGTTYHGL